MAVSELDKLLLGGTEPEISELDKMLLGETPTEPEPTQWWETELEPEKEPNWWEKAKDFSEWLYPKGWESVIDLPRQYGAALQKGGMAAGEAMTWLTRLLPGNENRKPYAEQTTAEQAWTVAQAGATFAVTQELIRAGIVLVKDLKLNIGTLFAKEQSKPIARAMNEIYTSIKGRPLSSNPEAIARYRAILAYKKDLPAEEVTRLTNFINKATAPALPMPAGITPTPTVTPTPVVTPPPAAVAPSVISKGAQALNIYIKNPQLGLNTIGDLQTKLQPILSKFPGVIDKFLTMASSNLPVERTDVLKIISNNKIDTATGQQVHKLLGTTEKAPMPTDKAGVSMPIKVYHGGAGVKELQKQVEILSPEEKLKLPSSGAGFVGLSTTTDKSYAQQFSENIAGHKEVVELYIKPTAKIKEIKGAIDDLNTNELTSLSKKFDVIKSMEENEYRILNTSAVEAPTPEAKPTVVPEIAPKIQEYARSRSQVEKEIIDQTKELAILEKRTDLSARVKNESIRSITESIDRDKIAIERVDKGLAKFADKAEIEKVAPISEAPIEDFKNLIQKEMGIEEIKVEIVPIKIKRAWCRFIEAELHPSGEDTYQIGVTTSDPIIHIKQQIIHELSHVKPSGIDWDEIEKLSKKYSLPSVMKEKAPPEELLATPKQIKQAHVIASKKEMISEKGKMKPQYRRLADMMIGKKSIKKMTKDEASIFIDALNKLPEPTMKKGKLVPPSIPRTTALVPEEFFVTKFKEPTIAKYLISQTLEAEVLGVKSLIEPSEIGKQEFDLELRSVSKDIDKVIKKIDIIGKTSIREKVIAKVKNIPTKAVANVAKLLNAYEEPPEFFSQKEKDVFNYFRSLNREVLKRENEVRKSLGLKPIEYRQAYLRHVADSMALEMLNREHPFPQGLKYWSEKIIAKKIFNPMELQRKLSDDLLEYFSRDLAYATKSMVRVGLKEIHLGIPLNILHTQLNALSKDTQIYKDLTPEQRKAYQESVIPASTKKWLIEYENQVIKGQQTGLDANVNRIVTKSGLKGLFDKALSPFGRTIGEKPITDLFQFMGRLTISGVMGPIPRQIIRNSFQSVQNLALYGVKATTKAFFPASVDKNLEELLDKSLFLKSYTGFEELPTSIMGKAERIWLGGYGAVAKFNAKTAMKAAYWDTLDLVKNPKYKDLGWADPARTKDTPKDFLYPSEKEKLLKEMEFGSGATQYQYIPMGMPELFRHKALIPLTRLQSWWMNYFAKFTREALHRAFKGETSYGAKLPWSRRVNYLKYILLGGAILTAMGYKKSFLIGVLPTYLSPAGQVALGLYTYATAKSDWQRQRALKQIHYSWTAFIPGSLAWKDFWAVWNGDKELKELFFYKQTPKAEKKKKKDTRPY